MSNAQQEPSELSILLEALKEAERLFSIQSIDPDDVMKHHPKAEQHLIQVRNWLKEYGKIQ